MTGLQLLAMRSQSGMSQKDAARRLGLSQSMFSQMENGKRRVSEQVAGDAAALFGADPTDLSLEVARNHTEQELAEELASLGYPGFAHLATDRRRNPAVVLVDALDRPDLDARVVEGLPWLPFRYPHMDWNWVVREAKLADLQNKVGFVVDLALQKAQTLGRPEAVPLLRPVLARLSDSRLVKETTLCQESWPMPMRRHAVQTRTPRAAFWNLATRVQEEHLEHYAE